MSGAQLTVDLYWRKDRNGENYLVGKIQAPAQVTLDLSKGFVVFVWPHSEESGDIPQMAIKERYVRPDSEGRTSEMEDESGDADGRA